MRTTVDEQITELTRTGSGKIIDLADHSSHAQRRQGFERRFQTKWHRGNQNTAMDSLRVGNDERRAAVSTFETQAR